MAGICTNCSSTSDFVYTRARSTKINDIGRYLQSVPAYGQVLALPRAHVDEMRRYGEQSVKI
ncbi:hypothetical protein N7537_004142 [Penicillium hordei]|uniref:Uncharacterized protein n=1 Tax=Penicillium hordei TaxID=40994 RepID=A0AAD6EBG9_9EURO|nr:uncharacterized protein N7537_004142 [Penicillium hordei]KAJ5607523.1 hypothetical protein N7537_004142 [Penicillium hordei]